MKAESFHGIFPNNIIVSIGVLLKGQHLKFNWPHQGLYLRQGLKRTNLAKALVLWPRSTKRDRFFVRSDDDDVVAAVAMSIPIFTAIVIMGSDRRSCRMAS